MYVWQSKKWPLFTWNHESLLKVLGQTRLSQGQLISRISALGMALGQEARAEILIKESVETSAIEGEKLNPDTVRSSVAKRLGLATAGLPPVDRRVDGLVQVLLDATTGYQKPLTLKRLKNWHATLFPTGYSGLHPIRAGQWRGPEPMQVVSGPIGREKIHYEAPPRNRIPKEMQQFLLWWKSSDNKIEGFVRAAVAHFYFVTIHPFEDGNGRLARALTDMALAQDENLKERFYSLSAQIMEERNTYYEILERTQRGKGDLTEWLLWFLGCSKRAIDNSELLISKVLAKADFWKCHRDASLNDHQRKVVSKLVEAGPGGFKGGLTTRKYVSIAKVSRATAYREIIDLAEKKILQPNSGKGRSVSYDLLWGFK